jgi:indole-3-glycerol phosphate synthase
MKFDFSKIGGEKTSELAPLKERRSLISAIDAAKKRGENAVIAEAKKRSPGAGELRDVDVAAAAALMEEGGACAISVLTDRHFGGCLEDLRETKKAVHTPVLRKDFIVDEFQLNESYAAGADAVLLIVALLGEKTKGFVRKARELGLEALVEVHSPEEIGTALESGAKLIGINNRDLRALKVDLGVTESLASRIPEDRVLVAESGIKNREDLRRLKKAGADAFLIGSSIMGSCDVGGKVAELVR